MSNKKLERIRQVLVNLVRACNITQTYVYQYYPCSGIFSAAEFVILSTTNRLKGYSLGKLLCVRDMILLIKHTVDWELIRQRKQMLINKDNARENNHRVDYDYKVGDNTMLTNHNEYKYATPY